jgi:YesN/AraC family two-component response regulator
MQDNIFDSRYLKIFFDRNDNFSNKLDNDNPVTQQIGRLLLEIEEEFSHKLSEYELMIKVKLMNILALLLRHYDYVMPDKQKQVYSSSNTKGLSEVINYIDSHLSEDLPLDDLARLAHKNYSYFSFMFKKYNGMTVSEYISLKRVRLAMEHLKSTNKTMLEIAGLSGFNSLANFNKSFKKIAGATPTEFRNKKFY